MTSKKVVVWEVMNDAYNAWRTFEPSDCKEIEKAYRLYKKNGTKNHLNFQTGRQCSISFKDMEETYQATGVVSPVRRLTFPASSAAGNQISWQWNANTINSPYWLAYAADVTECIENAFRTNQSPLDLYGQFPDLDYSIDFRTNTQTNNRSKFQRGIQRVTLLDKYPSDRRSSTVTAPTSNVTAPTSNVTAPTSNVTAPASNVTAPASNVDAPTTGHSSSVDAPSTSRATTSQGSGDGAPRGLPVCPDLKKFAQAVPSPSSDSCSICLASLQEHSGFSQATDPTSQYASVVELKKCNHSFHADCLSAAVKNDIKKASLTCPTCKTIYGVKEGSQPAGSMTHKVLPHSLPGHSGCGTIMITYNFRSGVQSAGHPNPGQRYNASSFPRTAYLPDSNEGRKVLDLLKIAWQRRLIFTIGRSVTTGADNTITWNEIHHKTEMGSNHSGHGYPDPNYLRNITDELKQQGVTEDDLK